MWYKDFVDYIIPLMGFIVSIVACIYTGLTYMKSRKILDVVGAERNYRWNRKELEILFSTLSVDAIESFFGTPDIIRDELWQGIRAVGLNTFQFKGKERKMIIRFIEELDSFCEMPYKQTPSGHWKYQPLLEYEPFDEDTEKRMMNKLYTKASTLRPDFEEVKNILLNYHVDIRNINERANDFYFKKQEELQQL